VRIANFVLLALFVVTLAGCGGDTKTVAPEKVPPRPGANPSTGGAGESGGAGDASTASEATS
jgi:hypothetical protein